MAGMQNCSMSGRYPFVYNQRIALRDVQHATILNVAVGADFNEIDVGSQHAVKPDAGPFLYGHLPDQYGCRSDKGRLMNDRLMLVERINHARKSITSAKVAAPSRCAQQGCRLCQGRWPRGRGAERPSG